MGENRGFMTLPVWIAVLFGTGLVLLIWLLRHWYRGRGSRAVRVGTTS